VCLSSNLKNKSNIHDFLTRSNKTYLNFRITFNGFDAIKLIPVLLNLKNQERDFLEFLL
jgi:hypothetical protein